MRDFSIERLTAMLEASPTNTFWRHDVDVSVDAALRMAHLEAQIGIEATFYLMLTSPFYDARAAALLSMQLAALGHRIGWHIDDCNRVVWASEMRGLPVSFHCPNEFVLWRDFQTFESAYASKWEGRYVSDSRGVFAHGDPEDRFDSDPLQVNLHAEHWFEPGWEDEIADDVYERFFHEPKDAMRWAQQNRDRTDGLVFTHRPAA